MIYQICICFNILMYHTVTLIVFLFLLDLFRWDLCELGSVDIECKTNGNPTGDSVHIRVVSSSNRHTPHHIAQHQPAPTSATPNPDNDARLNWLRRVNEKKLHLKVGDVRPLTKIVHQNHRFKHIHGHAELLVITYKPTAHPLSAPEWNDYIRHYCCFYR